MSVKCQTVINLIEQFASRKLAEDWDNPGLNIGDPAADIEGILVTLDVDSQVIEEAVNLGANMIVSHHPVIFKPIKSIRADQPHGKLVHDIIKNKLSVYCAHTNLDSAAEGVNQTLAENLKLKDIRVLNPDKPDNLVKLTVFVPETHADSVREAITEAGAGCIGKYSDCTFSVSGVGTFKAGESCTPFIGEVGVLEKVSEVKLETVMRETHANRIIKAMLAAHPYEEVAYDVYPLINDAGRLGLGRIGVLEKPVSLREFLDFIKEVLKVPALRYTGDLNALVKKVAVCGGSGAGFIKKAVFMGSDALLTGDVKYHDAQEADAMHLNLIDAGHYATEAPIVARLSDYVKEVLDSKGCSVPVFISGANKDPLTYY